MKVLPKIAYCMNLDSRTDRWAQVTKDFSKLQQVMDIKIQRVSAVPIASRPQQGVAQTVHKIINIAKQNNLEYVLILEDDLYIIDAQKVINCLNNVPDDWDILSGGVYHYVPDEGSNPNTSEWIKMRDFCSLHFIILRDTVYANALALDGTRQHMDRALGQLVRAGKLKMYLMYPMPCQQRPGFSNIRKREVNDNRRQLPWMDTSETLKDTIIKKDNVVKVTSYNEKDTNATALIKKKNDVVKVTPYNEKDNNATALIKKKNSIDLQTNVAPKSIIQPLLRIRGQPLNQATKLIKEPVSIAENNTQNLIDKIAIKRAQAIEAKKTFVEPTIKAMSKEIPIQQPDASTDGMAKIIAERKAILAKQKSAQQQRQAVKPNTIQSRQQLPQQEQLQDSSLARSVPVQEPRIVTHWPQQRKQQDIILATPVQAPDPIIATQRPRQRKQQSVTQAQVQETSARPLRQGKQNTERSNSTPITVYTNNETSQSLTVSKLESNPKPATKHSDLSTKIKPKTRFDIKAERDAKKF